MSSKLKSSRKGLLVPHLLYVNEARLHACSIVICRKEDVDALGLRNVAVGGACQKGDHGLYEWPREWGGDRRTK